VENRVPLSEVSSLLLEYDAMFELLGRVLLPLLEKRGRDMKWFVDLGKRCGLMPGRRSAAGQAQAPPRWIGETECILPGIAVAGASAVAPAASLTTTKQANIFRRDGDFWILRFRNGPLFQLVDEKGLQLIAYVLELNGRRISALELQRAVNGIPAMPGVAAHTRVNSQQLEEEDKLFETDPDSGSAANEDEEEIGEERAAFRNAVQELKQEEQTARDRGDAAAVLDVQQRQKALKQEYSKNFNQYGRPRKSDSPEEKARKAVWANISRSLDKIRKVDAQFAAFLNGAIKRPHGIYSYEPEGEVHWTF
jgi:hypothetical protein